MMLTKKLIIEYSLRNQKDILAIINTKYYMVNIGHGKNLIPPCFHGMPSPEQMYDDILFKILNGKVAKRGFENETKLKNYFNYSISRNMRTYAKLYYLDEVPELTDEERSYWHQFTRDFFDKILAKQL